MKKILFLWTSLLSISIYSTDPVQVQALYVDAKEAILQRDAKKLYQLFNNAPSDIVEKVLAKQDDLNKDTLLHFAARNLPESQDPAESKLTLSTLLSLIDHGAKSIPNKMFQTPAQIWYSRFNNFGPNALHGWTTAHYAANAGNVKILEQFLNQFPQHLNSLDSYGQAGHTPLWVAVTADIPQDKKLAVVSFLIKKGAQVDYPGTTGDTPLQLAAYNYALKQSNPDIFDLLVRSGARIDLLNLQAIPSDSKIKEHSYLKGANPLSHAALQGDLEAVKKEGLKDLEKKDAEGNTPLEYAVRGGNIEVIKYLIENGANVLIKDRYNATPLHAAAIVSRNNNIIDLLLKSGVPIDAQTNHGETPLFFAISHNNNNVALNLLSHGAQATLLPNNGESPLTRALENALSAPGETSKDLILNLIEKTPQSIINKQLANGQSALSLAFELFASPKQGNLTSSDILEIIKQLQSKGAQLDAVSTTRGKRGIELLLDYHLQEITTTLAILARIF